MCDEAASEIGKELIGILLAVVGNVGVNLGTNMVSLHHDLLTAGKGISWLQTAGFVVYAISAIMAFAAYMFGQAVVIAALGSVQFVSNVFCGKFFFGVDFTFKAVLATFVIVLGNTCIVAPAIILPKKNGTCGGVVNRDAGELFVSHPRCCPFPSRWPGLVSRRA